MKTSIKEKLSMLLYQLLLIAALTLAQTLQATEGFINSITNKSDMTFELHRGPLETMCTKGIPQICYENLKEIKPGNTEFFEKISSNIPFTIAPKQPFEFKDGSMKKVAPAFITKKTFTCIIEENTLLYRIGILPATRSIFFEKKSVQKINLIGTNLTINTNYSISIDNKKNKRS